MILCAFQVLINDGDIDEKLLRMFIINLKNLESDPYRLQNIHRGKTTFKILHL